MLRTAECVSPMHPDKICDRISDAILDACLEQDPDSRVAIEVMGGHGIITITGELTTKAYVDMREIAQRIAGEEYGVQVNVVKQSPEIAAGVADGGAGDQGIMVGYACRENTAMIPQELHLARSLCKYLYDIVPADGKTQVTVNEEGKIKTIVASWCGMEKSILESLIRDWLGMMFHRQETKDCKIFANPAGDWDIGGFDADTGLTGRKIAVDNYGPSIPIGGGAFSGKDASKVDRSAAYKARQLAVELMFENDNYAEVIVKLAYSIGIAKPVMATALAFLSDGEIWEEVDLPIEDSMTPHGIIESLDLEKPQFEKTAEWGHFGNDFKWDKNGKTN